MLRAKLSDSWIIVSGLINTVCAVLKKTDQGEKGPEKELISLYTLDLLEETGMLEVLFYILPVCLGVPLLFNKILYLSKKKKMLGACI
jgi:hypothetical protein